MRIESSWLLDCRPEDVFPHFFSAKMDDTFLLVPVSEDETRIRRITEFKGVPLIPTVSALALWFSLQQAHRYAAKKLRRLSK